MDKFTPLISIVCTFDLISSISSFHFPTELIELAKQMDGIWTAAGLDTSLLKRNLNYSNWFMTRLVPVITSTVNAAAAANAEAQNNNNNNNHIVAIQTTPHERILQYRTLWLIGCLTYELPDELHGSIYNALMQLLAVQDVVVCCATVTALRSMIDNAGFGRDPFTSQEGSTKAIIARLYYILQQNHIQSFDTRASILDMVSKLITLHSSSSSSSSSGSGLPGTVDEIVGPLPALWSSSVDQNLLRTSILTILTEIVAAVGSSSNDAARVHDQVLSLVQYSTNKNQSESIYLADEGFKLWSQIMQHLTVYTPNIHQLFNNVVVMMEHDYDHAEECARLIGSYVCSGGGTFINAYSTNVQHILVNTVTQVREGPALKVNQLILLLLQVYPRDMPALLEPVLGKMLHSIQRSANQHASSSSSTETPETTRVVVSHLNIFACLLHQTPDLFHTVLSHVATASNTTPDVLWSLLVNAWIASFDDIGGGCEGPWTRKRWVMALCVPLSTGDAVALSQFGALVNLCVQGLADLTTTSAMFMPSPNKGHGGSSSNATSLETATRQAKMQGGGGGGGGGGGAPRMSLEAAKKQQLRDNDPVYCTPLKATVQNAMQCCQTKVGASFNQLVTTVDSSTMAQLQSLLQ
jgi:hypothetical protein